MKIALSFDDVLIVPQFSNIRSRKECSTKVDLNGLTLDTPIFSANMDTITTDMMSNEMHRLGGAGVLHRFCTIGENIEMFVKAPNSIVSVGVGAKEQERALALMEAGATKWMIDVAHGASSVAAEMYVYLRTRRPDDWIAVGNFATLYSYWDFRNEIGELRIPNAIKVGVGGGSLCSTRVVTGCGLPTLESILEFTRHDDINPIIIADGGIKNSGDIAKALAAGADAVMIGGLLAGTDETPGRIESDGTKKYRGSASNESYMVQGKVDNHRTPEGESTWVPYKGSTESVIQGLKAGLQSAMSYVGVRTIEDFKSNAKLVQVTANGHAESKPHGKK